MSRSMVANAYILWNERNKAETILRRSFVCSSILRNIKNIEVFSAPGFTESGWYEYALMLYQPIKHTREYPYDREGFIRKFEMYAKGVMPDRIEFENLLYMCCDKSHCY